jgi:predicted nuclease of predicted toxin-antitoxin system
VSDASCSSRHEVAVRRAASPRLVAALAAEFPECAHVHELGLARAADDVVFEFARTQGFTIVSKDSDFVDLALARGFPPRVLWLRIGNCSTQAIANLLRVNAETIVGFVHNESMAILALS